MGRKTRTLLFCVALLALVAWCGAKVLLAPGVDGAMRLFAGAAFSLVAVEILAVMARTLLPLSDGGNLALATVQYVVVPVLALLLLAAVLLVPEARGIITQKSWGKAVITVLLLGIMIVNYSRAMWKKFRQERNMSFDQREKLAELDELRKEGALTAQAYIEAREQLLERQRP